MKNVITIIGLGAGDLNQLSLGIYKKLKQEKQCFVRTIDHPVISELQTEGIEFLSFDKVYEKHDQFEAVYEEISETLLKEAATKNVLICCARTSNGCRKNGATIIRKRSRA